MTFKAAPGAPQMGAKFRKAKVPGLKEFKVCSPEWLLLLSWLHSVLQQPLMAMPWMAMSSTWSQLFEQ